MEENWNEEPSQRNMGGFPLTRQRRPGKGADTVASLPGGSEGFKEILSMGPYKIFVGLSVTMLEGMCLEHWYVVSSTPDTGHWKTNTTISDSKELRAVQ